MSGTQITEIVAWLRAHPEHVYAPDVETFEDDTPAEAWFRFCRNPLLINEYEDAENCDMEGMKIINGCTYIFRCGQLKACRCNITPILGRDRCSFHSHVIFSTEIRTYLRDYHNAINTAFMINAPNRF